MQTSREQLWVNTCVHAVCVCKCAEVCCASCGHRGSTLPLPKIASRITTDTGDKQFAALKFCCHLKKTATETYTMLHQVYGDHVLPYSIHSLPVIDPRCSARERQLSAVTKIE